MRWIGQKAINDSVASVVEENLSTVRKIAGSLSDPEGSAPERIVLQGSHECDRLAPQVA
jgi:hypothetical protein